MNCCWGYQQRVEVVGGATNNGETKKGASLSPLRTTVGVLTNCFNSIKQDSNLLKSQIHQYSFHKKIKVV